MATLLQVGGGERETNEHRKGGQFMKQSIKRNINFPSFPFLFFFRTLELQLIGPSLVGAGIFFTLLRILFCTVPSCCRACFSCCCRAKADKADKKKLVENGTARVSECELHSTRIVYVLRVTSTPSNCRK